jgi:hypothetical protein
MNAGERGADFATFYWRGSTPGIDRAATIAGAQQGMAAAADQLLMLTVSRAQHYEAALADNVLPVVNVRASGWR